VGPLTYEDGPDTAPPGVVSDDIQALRESSVYAEPAWLPEGYTLSSVSTAGHDSEHVIAAVYTGPGKPIQVNRVRRFSWPLDVILPAGDSLTVFETPVLEGKAAVLYYPKPGSPMDSGQTVLSFVDGDVETTVLGDRLDPDTATRIALSLICATSCVSSSGAINGPGSSDGVSGPPAQGDAAIDLSGVSGADEAGISQATSSEFADDQHRVVAGLALTTVRVTSWWDHGSAYGEAALDLQHPDGEDYTKNVNVYVITWPWSGSGRMFFTTDEYQHIPYGSYCTGRYVNLTDAGGNPLGRLTYVHVANEAGIGDAWYTNTGTWTIRYIGQVATTQLADCVSPYHPHLHQGQNVPSDQTTYNTALPQPPGIINPTNDPANNWMLRVTLIDSDGDGCSDSAEAAGAPDSQPGSTGAYDPHNYWDFYDVPIPAKDDPTPNGPRDRAVNMMDVTGVLKYVGAEVNGPSNGRVDYDSLKDGDWNGDTVVNSDDKVGRRYDRSPSPSPSPPYDAGPPDGYVNMQDVTVLVKQVGLDCTGP
jgi:hypothetical protein